MRLVRLELVMRVVVACLLVTLLSAAAQAQNGAREPSLADKETARNLFRHGDEKFRHGDYEAALKSFLAADALVRAPTTGLEVGRTQAQLGKLLEARETLRRVMSGTPDPSESSTFSAARDEAAALFGEIGPRIPTVELHVWAADSHMKLEGLEVVVDGAPIPLESLGSPRKVNPGKHVVVVQAAGFAPQVRDIEVLERQAIVEKFELEAASTAGPYKPPAKVPPRPQPQPDEPTASGIPTLAWVGFGVGAAGLVVGGITGIAALVEASGLQDVCPDKQCEPVHEYRLDRTVLLSHVSTVSLVIGLVGAGGGVAALLLMDDAPSERAALEPLLGPGWVGLRGAF